MKSRLIFIIALLTNAFLIQNTASAQDDPSGIKLFKTAEKVPGKADTYKITMSSFVAGEPVFKEVTSPVDVAIVIDVSASLSASVSGEPSNLGTYSMDKFQFLTTGDHIGYLHTTGWDDVGVWDTEEKERLPFRNYQVDYGDYTNNSGVRIYKAGKLRYRLGLGGVAESQAKNLAYLKASLNGVAADGWYYGDGTNVSEPSQWTLYTPSASDMIYTDVKVDLLELGLRVFLSQIAANSQQSSADHRIGYACFAAGLGGTQELIPAQQNRSMLMEKLSNMNDELHQGTNPVPAIEKAVAMFDNLDEVLRGEGKTEEQISERNRVVVFFTDGRPSYGVGASDVIAAMKPLKDDGISVYSVGLFDPAEKVYDGETEITVKSYLELVSSDYPQARSYSDQGTRNNDGIEYAMEAEDGDLSTIFKSIASSAGSTAYKLTAESAVAVDVITEDFELPSGFSPSDVRTSMYVCTGADNTSPDGYSWVPYTGHETDLYHGDAPVAQIMPVPGKNSRVKVNGFYYSKDDVIVPGTLHDISCYGNWVGQHADGVYRGKKLVIEFEVRLRDSSIGGYLLPTNEPSSGIYVDDKEIKPYPVPTVDVPSLIIIKEGLAQGESAVFDVTKASSDLSYRVLLTEKGDGSMCYVVLRDLEPGSYTVTETEWSWTYGTNAPVTKVLSLVPSIPADYDKAEYREYLQTVQDESGYNGMYYTMDNALHVMFKFVNTPKENTPLHGEDVKKNTFRKGSFGSEYGVEGNESAL